MPSEILCENPNSILGSLCCQTNHIGIITSRNCGYKLDLFDQILTERRYKTLLLAWITLQK